MKIRDILESATAGATSSANIGTSAIGSGGANGKKSYTGSPGRSGTKTPPQHRPKKQKPTDNALDSKTNIFGAGASIKR